MHTSPILVQSPSRLQRRPYPTRSVSNGIGHENGQQKFDTHVHIQMRQGWNADQEPGQGVVSRKWKLPGRRLRTSDL